MSVDFEIIVGTYEQFLLGYKVQNVDNTYNLERSFATHSHLASIRTVASNKHYLASAGADDSVYLYDMRYRVESGRLMHHTDTVNCIAFTPEASHILTASSDGSIGIVRCGNWQLEKHWKAPHKENAVNTLAVHPTGKLAMSAGGDGVLRTWNLVKGRQAYATNLVPRLKFDAKNVTIIRWSPDGEKYLLVSNCKIDVYSVETAGLCAELSFDSKVVCVEFVKDEVIAIGHEDGKIRLYDLAANTDALEIVAHDVRVKCLAHRNNYLVSASSSGEIKLWRCGKKKLNMLSRATCGVRITCMTLTQPCPDLTVKREEPKAIEEVENKKKNVFRMRQEVTIEDEGEDEARLASESLAKKKKKARGKKRAAEIVEEVEEAAPEVIPTKKQNKKKKLKIVEEENVESKKKKMRTLSVEKSQASSGKTVKDSPPKRRNDKLLNGDAAPAKKRKTLSVEKSQAKNSLPKSNKSDKSPDGEAIVAKKKKKKTNKAVPSIEKPSKPLSNKRKQQNVISSTTTGFPAKTKKKKLAR